MVVIRLPDGSKRDFDGPVTGLELAESIGRRLAKDAVAVRVDGDLWDLNRPIESDSDVQIVTREEDDGVEILRHDAAHLLAEAVKELYPETQVTIGPAIDNGFYYDFAREEPFRPEDLEQIEQRMREIVDRDESVQREVWDRDEAVRFFTDLGEHYKAEIIGAIPAGESITLYRQGRFIDLCRGPHLPSTGRLGKAFRLTKLAGAYWRGDSNNAMLQRIYGTAWPDKKKLDKYLHQLEEAERRDHRRLGREMDLFHFQEEAPGSVFWHPKGWSLFQSLIDYMRTRQDAAGYREINTPELMDRSLWVKSGHVEKFGDNMFVTQTPDERVFALKPMNCPGHVQVFKQGITSYRELPLRLSEFGSVHRYEPSGALHGLMRVRSFTQDDAHIFCTEADRPENRVGADSVWDESEQALMTALKSTDLPYELNPGEGAFYGPKLEFVLTDAIGRDWQCGTVQVDLNLPDRLGASFIGEDGQKHPPVMIHRALFGSLERFTGILLEHYAGRLPLWLAPTQVVVATITSDADAYAMEVAATLRHHGIRVETDLRNEKINYKVREHSLAKVPVMFVAGKREAENHSVSIRRLGQKHQTSAPLASAVTDVARECAQKRVVDGEAA
ncbi:MAG: threonine--tRNA ligase [Chromatiales bacterium]